MCHIDENPFEYVPEAEKANLGLATIEELINELQARVNVAVTIGEQWPHYKTVDSE